MCEALLPPPIPDHFRNIPGVVDRGSAGMHPLQIHLRKLSQTEAKNEYDLNAVLYGYGFAGQLEDERKILEKATNAYTSYSRPTNVALEILSGEIEDIDFDASFAPDGMRTDIEFDSHDIQESRFFK